MRGRREVPAAGSGQPGDGPGPGHGREPETAGRGGGAASGGTAKSPVLVLSYAYSGAARVQDLLAAGTNLACTSGTGIIPLADAAAETWRRVEGQPAEAMSHLAVSTIRGLVAAQVTLILSGSGQSRWCELVTAPPSAVGPFLQIYPQTGFVCVHRSCTDVIRAGVQASPWGLYGQGLMPYLSSFPGNTVAALAAYWLNSAEELLAFEMANAGISYRVRYEDVLADPDQALATVRASLRLDGTAPGAALLGFFDSPEPDTAGQPPGPVPAEMIPEPLRERIGRLHAGLGYPPL